MLQLGREWQRIAYFGPREETCGEEHEQHRRSQTPERDQQQHAVRRHGDKFVDLCTLTVEEGCD
jgi:hypothetical protein